MRTFGFVLTLLLSPFSVLPLDAAESWTGTLKSPAVTGEVLKSVLATSSQGVLTIPVRTCDFVEKVPPSEPYDYEEKRFCDVPLPVGATVKTITALTWNYRTELELFDEVASQATISLVVEKAEGTAADIRPLLLGRGSSVRCTDSLTDSNILRLTERAKTFNCVGAPVADGNTAYYIDVRSSARAVDSVTPGYARDRLLEQKDFFFPFVRLLKVEYETTR